MIVQRGTYIPKRGQQEKVVALIKAGDEYSPFQVQYRILLPSLGPFDVVVFELEFKDLTEQERFWKGWLEKAPESFLKEWNDNTENGGGTEIWQLTE